MVPPRLVQTLTLQLRCAQWLECYWPMFPTLDILYLLRHFCCCPRRLLHHACATVLLDGLLISLVASHLHAPVTRERASSRPGGMLSLAWARQACSTTTSNTRRSS